MSDLLKIGGGLEIPDGPHAKELMNFLGSGPDYRVHGMVVREAGAEAAGAPVAIPELPLAAAGVADAALHMPR